MRTAALVAGAACVALLALAAAACGTGGFSSGGSQGAGKQLFVDRCGGCHVLADAGTLGAVGPDLDDAFAQARADGMTTETFTQVVAGQVKFPITKTSTGATGMPGLDETLPACDDVEGEGFCVEDQGRAVDDIAVYVAAVAGTGAGAERPTDGKSIFASTCGACHVLADAGTTGTVGPNLDDSRPSTALAVDRVTNGRGRMPAFKGSLSPEQIRAVAEYVSAAAGS